jgi:hypothetical protein
MAIFELQTPDGQTFEVDAPDEKSALEALDQMQAPAAPSQAAQGQQPEAPLAWSDVPGKALENAPRSALEFGKAIVQPILHPVTTAKNLDTLARGAVMNIPGVRTANDWAVKNLGFNDSYTMPGAKEQLELAGNVGRFYKDRYGSIEGIKQTLANDPVGALADASTVLSGGGAALARVPGSAARVTSRGLLAAPSQPLPPP